MCNRRKHHPARQLSPRKLGLLKWQRDFWLVLLDHVLADKLGPPDLMQNDSFENPAVIRYAVTTPDLLHSFRRYNDGKPYPKQVRPFGFMVMFQQVEKTDHSNVMRVIAPFNRNPSKAARKAFDRDTGAAVSVKQLKTYTVALRTYHNHPEAKFRNGERGDRGPTTRRHIIARSMVHIGKEANKLDIQTASGVDPNAQVEFCAISESRVGRCKAIRTALKKLGPSRLARETDLSRQYLSKLAGGSVATTEASLAKIEQAIATLDVMNARKQIERETILAWLRAECERISMRQVAQNLGVDAGVLSRVLAGLRHIPKSLVRAMMLINPNPLA